MSKFIDITGQKFNKWTVIKLIKKGTKITSTWLCWCECGNESIISITDLRSGKSSKCKLCAAKETSIRECKDLTNKIFGKWTVIKRIGTNKYRRPIWLCRCKCNKLGKIPSSNLLTGLSTCCGHCNHYQDMKCRSWSSIINGAKHRNLEFSISIEYAWEIFEKQNRKCILTNVPIFFSNDYKIQSTASLDRIDSKKGYVEGNIQWVHKDVNVIKNILSNDELINICITIAKLHPNYPYKECYLNTYSIYERRYD